MTNNSKKNIQFRRQLVLSYLSKGYNQRSISNKLMCSQSSISRDVHIIKEQNKKDIKQYVDNLAFEYHLAIIGLDNTLEELWKQIENTDSERIKQTALSILPHVYKERIAIISATQPLQKVIQGVDRQKQQAQPNQTITVTKQKDIEVTDR